jgi:hypothetical protein
MLTQKLAGWFEVIANRKKKRSISWLLSETKVARFSNPGAKSWPLWRRSDALDYVGLEALKSAPHHHLVNRCNMVWQKDRTTFARVASIPRKWHRHRPLVVNKDATET